MNCSTIYQSENAGNQTLMNALNRLGAKRFTRAFLWKLLIIAFVCCVDQTQATAQGKHLALGAELSVDHYDFDFIRVAESNRRFVRGLNSGLGIAARYNVGNLLFFRTGVRYAQKGYRVEYRNLFVQANDPLIPKESQLTNAYLDVPFQVGLSFAQGRRFRISPSLGVTVGTWLSQRETTVFEDDSKRESNFESRWNTSSLVFSAINIGIEYHLTHDLFLVAEPYFGYALSNPDPLTMNSNPYAYGLMLRGMFLL